MSETSHVLKNGQTLEAMLDIAEASDEAKALLRPGRAPRDFVELLVKRQLFPDAIAFLAHMLPAREGIWWAWSCAGDVAGPEPAPAVRNALEATRRWILEPSDANRRAAFDAADALEFEFAAGITGLAVFLCGDTLGPPEAPPAPPEPYAAAKAITGAILLAGATDPDRAAEMYRAFIARGMERADKGRIWAPETAPARN